MLELGAATRSMCDRLPLLYLRERNDGLLLLRRCSQPSLVIQTKLEVRSGRVPELRPQRHMHGYFKTLWIKQHHILAPHHHSVKLYLEDKLNQKEMGYA